MSVQAEESKSADDGITTVPIGNVSESDGILEEQLHATIEDQVVQEEVEDKYEENTL